MSEANEQDIVALSYIQHKTKDSQLLCSGGLACYDFSEKDMNIGLKKQEENTKTNEKPLCEPNGSDNITKCVHEETDDGKNLWHKSF